jgi:hypothetical protein
MAKFLITYHGGGEMPADPGMRDQMLKAFAAWAAGVGDKMVDPGAPPGPAKSAATPWSARTAWMRLSAWSAIILSSAAAGRCG